VRGETGNERPSRVVTANCCSQQGYKTLSHLRSGSTSGCQQEFEFAARGGLDRNRYAWGNELNPAGKAAANTWQGRFPARDRGEDGFKSRIRAGAIRLALSRYFAGSP
jgi:hypothetical protein